MEEGDAARRLRAGAMEDVDTGGRDVPETVCESSMSTTPSFLRRATSAVRLRKAAGFERTNSECSSEAAPEEDQDASKNGVTDKEEIRRSISKGMFKAMTLDYFREHRLSAAVHAVLFAALLPHCAPQKGVMPTETKWHPFPLLTLVYAGLKVLRPALRCVTFVFCMLRCARPRAGTEEKVRNHAWELAVETAFATIWPTEGIANIAFTTFFVSRAIKIARILLEVVVDVNYEGDSPFCEAVSVCQGLSSRSYWVLGFVFGFRYFKEVQIQDVPSDPEARDNLPLHPRMWKMIQSRSFYNHARFAMLAWLLVSMLECSLLFHWEAGVTTQGEELDAFRYSKDFFEKYSPDFNQWRFARVVVGDWRETFYFMMLFPKMCSLFALASLMVMSTSWLPGFTCAPWPRLRAVNIDALLGMVSYIFCISAHQLQFLVLCLVVSWECKNLQLKCEAFQEGFGALSTEERLQRHQDLGKRMLGLGKRLHPIILYLVLERVVHMSFDVAQWRCESVPFTLLHYVFRHLVRIFGVSFVIWRIGRLNASIYDDLTGKVQFQLMSCHQNSSLSNEELRRVRWELKDWVTYLRHNSEGSRRYCLRVCGFQCCLRSHTVAFWTVTLVLIPIAQKLFGLLPGLGIKIV